MAPPDLGSQSEESHNESSQLEYIEQTLRKLHQSTLEIKKRNDELMRQIGPTINRPPIQPGGWKGRPVDVPNLPAFKQPKTSKLDLNNDFEEILKESVDMRRKMEDTLKVCAETRRHHEKYLKDLRKDAELLVLSTKQTGSMDKASTGNVSQSPPNPSSLFYNIKAVVRRLGFGAPQTPGKTARNTFSTSSVPIPVRNSICHASNKPPTLPLKIGDVNNSKHPKSSELRQASENRRLSCRPTSPPPPIPQTKVLPGFIQCGLEKGTPHQSIQRNDSCASTEASSDFEYVDKPLMIVQAAVTDSEDSIVLQDLTSNDIHAIDVANFVPVSLQKFQKNKGPKRRLPKVYRRQEHVTLEGIQSDSCDKQVQNRSKKIRPDSPPPVLLSSKLPSLVRSMELPRVPDDDEETSNADCGSVSEGLDGIHDIDMQSKDQSPSNAFGGSSMQTSALQLGVPIQRPEVEIKPWTTGKVYEIMNVEAQAESPAQVPPTKDDDCKCSYERVIEEQFSFLNDDTHDTFPCPYDDCETRKSCKLFQLITCQLNDVQVTKELKRDFCSTWRVVIQSERFEAFSVSHKSRKQSEAIIDSAHNSDHPPAPPPMPPPFLPLDSKNPAPIPLPVFPLDEAKLQKSIFNELNHGEAIKITVDTNFIQNNFVKVVRGPTKANKTSTGPRFPPQEICSRALCTLSPRRQKALEIGARKIQGSSREMEDAIRSMNWKFVDEGDVEILLQMISKDNEATNELASLDNVAGTLSESLALIINLFEIPRLRQKLEAIGFLLSFDGTITSTLSRITMLKDAACSIRLSTKFRQILQVILAFINDGFPQTSGKRVKGFQLQSLSRLSKLKSTKGDMSLLQYIVDMVREQTPSALDFCEDFVFVEEASRLSCQEIKTVLQEMKNELDSVQCEMELIQANREYECQSLKCQFLEAQSQLNENLTRHHEAEGLWEATINELKSLVYLFGLANADDEHLMEPFHIMKEFIQDFKRALHANQRSILVPQAQNELSLQTVSGKKSFMDDTYPLIVKRRKSAGQTLGTGLINPRRKSLGSITFQTLISSDDALQQPDEFLNVLRQTTDDAQPEYGRKTRYMRNKDATARRMLCENQNRERQ